MEESAERRKQVYLLRDQYIAAQRSAALNAAIGVIVVALAYWFVIFIEPVVDLFIAGFFLLCVAGFYEEEKKK